MTCCLCQDCNFVSLSPCLPALTPIPDKSENWMVDCHWCSPLINGKAVLIRRGMVTDGASIPRIAWRVVGHPFSKGVLPHALGHDALYASELLSRDECDAWFLTSMAKADENYALGVSWAERNVVWSAVRSFGWSVWNRHTNASVEEARKYVTVLDGIDYNKMKLIQDVRFFDIDNSRVSVQ